MGDSIGDTTMADGATEEHATAQTVLKVGFLNEDLATTRTQGLG
jgi:hypothetical protein